MGGTSRSQTVSTKLQGIAPDVPFETIWKGIFPFLVALIIFTVILLVFPQIATFLPSLVAY